MTLLTIAAPAAAADLRGTWTGTWIKSGDALPVTVTFAKSGETYTGTFDSDALQVAAIPFREVGLRGVAAHWVLSGDTTTTTFDGALKGKTLRGTFVENGVNGTFSLKRTASAVAAVQSQDVTFKNGDVVLSGTLLFPKTKGPHPAIIFLHGAGDEGRWANRYLAQRFAQAGFVALIFDKRGVGQSTGDWHMVGFEELAADALAGIRMLQTLPDVDAKKVGVYGHSQGGSLAPLVAVRTGNLAFVIGSAAGGVDLAQMEEYSVGNSLDIAKMSPAEAADAKTFVHAIVDVAYRGKPRAELDSVAAKFKSRPWYFEPPPPDNFYWAFSRRIAGYSPIDTWRQVRAPVLLLYGDKDERVPPKESSAAIVMALHSASNDRVSVKMFPGADHVFAPPLTNGGWPKHLPGYADAMIDWAKAQTK